MKRLIIGLVIALAMTPAHANDVRSGNGSINPDTGAELQADYQIVITDATGIVIAVSKQMPTTVPSGANIWSNNGSWGDVQVGGTIKNGSSGNLYAPPGIAIPVEPVKVVIPVSVPDTSTVVAYVPEPTITPAPAPVVEVAAQVPATETATVTTKADTATVVIETATAVIETATVLIDYSTVDWATIDWETIDWNAFWVWFEKWFEYMWGIKL